MGAKQGYNCVDVSISDRSVLRGIPITGDATLSQPVGFQLGGSRIHAMCRGVPREYGRLERATPFCDAFPPRGKPVSILLRELGGDEEANRAIIRVTDAKEVANALAAKHRPYLPGDPEDQRISFVRYNLDLILFLVIPQVFTLRVPDGNLVFLIEPGTIAVRFPGNERNVEAEEVPAEDPAGTAHCSAAP